MNEPNCRDERGCPQPGKCSRELTCPLSVLSQTEIAEWQQAQADWREEARGWSGL